MRRNPLSKILAACILFSMAIFPRSAEADKKQALLVIDIQTAYVGLYQQQAFDAFLANVNGVIDKASISSMPIIYIRQEGGGEIYDKVHIKSSIEFEKTAESAFTVDALNDYLTDQNIKVLYIVGLDAAYCVSATAHVSVGRGYKTFVFGDAIITYQDWAEVKRYYEDIDLISINSEQD